jgi:hypothetical protein
MNVYSSNGKMINIVLLISEFVSNNSRMRKSKAMVIPVDVLFFDITKFFLKKSIYDFK